MATKFGVGGIARHVLALGRHLQAQGHSVAYAGSEGAWLNREIMPAMLALDTHKVSGDWEGASAPVRLAHLAKSAAALRGWVRRHPVDLVHTHESAPALVARLALVGARRPIVLTYHGSELSRAAQFGVIARRCADQVIAVSRRSAEELATLGGVPRERLNVIGLGLPPAPAVDPTRAQTLRRQLLGENGLLLVTTIARLTHQKGIDVLVEVARRVVAARPDVHFAVVGDGPQEAEAKAWVQAAGLTANVHLLGRSEEPYLHLAAADVFMLTSRWEALPFTINEAFQAGLPAIATDCGGVVELIDDAVGRVLPVGDADGLAAAVLEIAADEGLRGRMAAASLARSLEDRFRPEFNHRQIEALYGRLLASRA